MKIKIFSFVVFTFFLFITSIHSAHPVTSLIVADDTMSRTREIQFNSGVNLQDPYHNGSCQGVNRSKSSSRDMEPIRLAQEGQPDHVTIIKTNWIKKVKQMKKKGKTFLRKKRFLIIKATSDAPVGSVILTAEVIDGGVTKKAGEMSYNADEGYYHRTFFNVLSLPEEVKVTSSGGGSDTAPVPFNSEETNQDSQ
ncbi:MAG: hypothetical protein SV375_11235 [Thermodesulfobacteriota bacterium]|nr:hypothetical protein [Thermodesulfobacteriota bacterium]